MVNNKIKGVIIRITKNLQVLYLKYNKILEIFKIKILVYS